MAVALKYIYTNINAIIQRTRAVNKLVQLKRQEIDTPRRGAGKGRPKRNQNKTKRYAPISRRVCECRAAPVWVRSNRRLEISRFVVVQSSVTSTRERFKKV